MDFKIISDSSSDVFKTEDTPFESVPLKIITDEKEYIDDETLNVDEMITDLLRYRGRSKSSCPNTSEWLSAFGDNENIFCVTITSGLSGSYNSASLALNEYLTEFPERRGYVIDSLSAGPECALIVEKLEELIKQGLKFDDIKTGILEYKEKTRLAFCLSSLQNLANNGRVSIAVAKISGILGISIIGKASSEGTLEVTGKTKGSKRALSEILKNMHQNGYVGGKVRIHHCQNELAAKKLSEMIKNEYPKAQIGIFKTGALCSFYAESGGFLVGYEVN